MIRTDGKQSRAWGVPKGGGIFWKHLPRRVVRYLQELEDSGSGSVSRVNQVPVVKASHFRMLSSMVMCGNVKIQRESTRQGRVSICQQGLWIKALAKNISKHIQASVGKEGRQNWGSGQVRLSIRLESSPKAPGCRAPEESKG